MRTIGRVVAVNVGKPRTVNWHGRAVTTAIWKQPVTGRPVCAGVNIDGDDQADRRVHGGATRSSTPMRPRTMPGGPPCSVSARAGHLRREPHRRRSRPRPARASVSAGGSAARWCASPNPASRASNSVCGWPTPALLERFAGGRSARHLSGDRRRRRARRRRPDQARRQPRTSSHCRHGRTRLPRSSRVARTPHRPPGPFRGVAPVGGTGAHPITQPTPPMSPVRLPSRQRVTAAVTRHSRTPA